MTVYLVANNHVTDYEGNIAAYRAAVTDLSTGAGGRYLIRGTPIKVLEGQFLPRQRNLVSAWPDAATLEKFWWGDAYQKGLKPHRAGTAVNDIAMFNGENDPPPPGGEHVYMFVHAQLAGLSGAAYGKAVAGLLPTYGGRYLLRGAPVKTLEGEWLDRVRVVVSVWPNLKAATDFWYSDVYQKETKPLRDGTGVYDVALFAAAS
jgi:uncharacterized protein (DUF1330 family)